MDGSAMSHEHPRTPLDQEKREVVRHLFDRNIMVLAGAGAGKTHELVQRMTNLVESGAADVDRIVAITFTRKAAGEMRGRFALALRARAAAVDGPPRARLERALSEIDRCFVGTIHAFCGRLLRERPVEAGIPPDFVELEGPEENDLAREAWDAFVDRAYADDDDLLVALETVGLSSEDLYDFYMRRYGSTDLALKPCQDLEPDLTDAIAALRAFVDDCLARCPDPIIERDDAIARLDEAVHHLERIDPQDTATAADLLARFAAVPKITQRCWGDNKVFAKSLKEEGWPQFIEEVVTPALASWRRWVYCHASAFVEAAVASFAERRQREGRLIFHDLLMRATGMLRDNPDVRRYFQRRFACVLVDEFQDTDPVQAELLFYLTGTDVTERDWRRLEPRQGSLFVVGDAKQSIYRFRRADVDTFEFVRRRITETGGVEVRLDTSFRSLGNLCGWFNETFEPLFATSAPPYQSAFAPMLRFRPDGTADSCVWKLTIPKVHRNSRRQIAQDEAESIAAFIEAAIAGGTAFNGSRADGDVFDARADAGDFMILTRTKNQLSTYARALEARSIPYDIVGAGSLGAIAEVRSVVELLECALRPDDPVTLFAYLRGPLVGLSDPDFLTYRQAGGTFDYRSRLPDLDDDLGPRLESAIETVRNLDALVRRVSPSAALERILADLGVVAFSSIQEMGGTRAGSLHRLIAIVRELEDDGLNWAQITRKLRRIVDDPAHSVEAMTIQTGRPDVVRIMNLHQSKGLQAGVVFLADSGDTRSNHTPDVHVVRGAATSYLSTTIRRSEGNGSRVLGEPPGWPEDQAEEEQYQDAEGLRLVYVAATRAREMLVVCRYQADTESRGPWGRLSSRIEEAPELHVPAETVRQPERPSAPPSYFERTEFDRTDFERAAEATYELGRVTPEETDPIMPSVSQGGRGREFGSIVHEVLEACIEERLPEDLDRYASVICEIAGLPDAAPEVVRIVTRLKSSPLWEEIRNADDVFVEVPFAESTGSTVTRGTIDLVYGSADEWTIVDYKTDVKPEADVVLRYGPQVRTYVEAWSRMAQSSRVRGGLWLTSEGRFIPVVEAIVEDD
jgi:ATP-dependent helicase/nuclease subunit A